MDSRGSELLMFIPLCSVTQMYLAPNIEFGAYAGLVLQVRFFSGRDSSEVQFFLALNFYLLLIYTRAQYWKLLASYSDPVPTL